VGREELEQILCGQASACSSLNDKGSTYSSPGIRISTLELSHT